MTKTRREEASAWRRRLAVFLFCILGGLCGCLPAGSSYSGTGDGGAAGAEEPPVEETEEPAEEPPPPPEEEPEEPPPSGGTGVSHGDVPWLSGSYFPAWKDIAPDEVLTFEHDGSQSDTENGAALKDAIRDLEPGQMLKIGPGTYSINGFYNLVLRGTEQKPIWIVAADPDNKPVITRPNNNENVINIGSGSRTEYVCLRHLEVTGGSHLMRLFHCEHLWIDQCYLHHGAGVGISASKADTRYLYITRNEIRRPGHNGGNGEGMYLGAHDGSSNMSYSIVALNHVHDTIGAKQGDGIEIKQGSFNNWIVDNYVHDTNYPCITVMGTDGKGVNLVERNVLHDSRDNTMQVQGEAIVCNNLIMGGANGVLSKNQEGTTRDLVFIHNTILNDGTGVRLSSWNNKPGMVFANNVVYSRDGTSINFSGGSGGVTVSGNVVVGRVSGVSSGFVEGNGLSDFVDAAWDGSRRDARPSSGSAIRGEGDSDHAVDSDITGDARAGELDPGAFDAD